MTYVCVPGITKNDHLKNMQSIIDVWNSSPEITKLHGKVTKNNDARELLREFSQEVLLDKGYFHQDWTLNSGQVKRIKNEISSYNSRLRKKFVGPIGNIFGVGEKLSKKSPLARDFYLDINNVYNYERTQRSRSNNLNARITDNIRDAFINTGLQGRYDTIGIKFVKDLQKVQNDLAQAETPSLRATYESKLEALVNSDDGKLFREFKSLMKMNKEEWKVRKISNYHPNILKAAKYGRELVKEMGPVYINGLKKYRDAISMKHIGSTNKNNIMSSRTGKRIHKTIDEAIARIEKGLDAEGYLPSYIIYDIISATEAMNKYLNNTNPSYKNTRFENIMNLFSDIGTIPSHAKPKNEMLNNTYNENPLFILNQYSNEAINFNKISHIQTSYQKAIKRLYKSDTDTEFVRGLGKWLDDVYKMSTEGLSNRPDWINNGVRLINSTMIAKTMSLNMTGAVKNAGSILYYLANQGVFNFKRAISDYNNLTEKGGIRELVNKVEKESGFLFSDATELFAEGLLPSKGVYKPEDIIFNPETGRVTVKGDDIWSAVAKTGDWSITKSLFLHRWTENNIRKWMFRTAFINKYRQLESRPEFAASKGQVGIQEMSKNFAIKTVNAFAFEYALHSKAKALRGVAGVLDEQGNKVLTWKVGAGAAGQLSFGLMHYPLSLLHQQGSQVVGGLKAVRAGQWDSQELNYLMRYAGIYAALQIGSIVSNLELMNLFENETLNWFERVENDLTRGEGYDVFGFDPDQIKGKTRNTYGLVSEVTGPLPGTIKFMVLNSGLYDNNQDEISQILLGNIDYQDPDNEKYKWYNLNTEVGRWYSKIGPAIRDGRGWDIPRGWLNMYPSQETKDARKWINKQTGLEFFRDQGRKLPNQRVTSSIGKLSRH